MSLSMPDSVLVYDRTQYLIDAVEKGVAESSQVFASAGGVAFASGDGAVITFQFNLASAYYNAEDLNRIEDWTKWLAEMLNYYGYKCTISTVPTRWDDTDNIFCFDDHMLRIINNVTALRDAFAQLPDWRELELKMFPDWQDANNIEWDLSRVYVWVGRMVSTFWYSGEVYAGEV